MASQVSSATNAPQAAQVQSTHNVPKVAKASTNAPSSAPQDTVSISSQARAAQQVNQPQQNSGDADRDGDSK
jgi:hypothetical protein